MMNHDMAEEHCIAFVTQASHIHRLGELHFAMTFRMFLQVCFSRVFEVFNVFFFFKFHKDGPHWFIKQGNLANTALQIG